MNVGSDAYCSGCGAPRPTGAQFCPTCGRAFDGASPAASAEAFNARLVAMFGGIAWLVSAAMIAYLGLLQLGYVGTIIDPGGLQATAIWNLVTAALTLYFAARLLTSPTRGILGTSAAWAALAVIWDGYQIANGVTHWAYIGATVAALVAGVLSLVARSSMPAPPPATWTPTAPAAGPNAAPVAEASTSRPRSRRPLLIGGLVIAGLGLAAVAAVLLGQQLGQGAPVPSREVSAKEFGALWPLNVSGGALRCEGGGTIVFRAGIAEDTDYRWKPARRGATWTSTGSRR